MRKKINEEKNTNLEYIDRIRSKRRKGLINLKSLILLIVFMLGTMGLLFSPIFQVKDIKVTQMDRYTEAEILSIAGLSYGDNMFAFNRFAAKKELENDPYIKSVDIDYEVPGIIELNIDERKVRGYVPYLGSYLYIDEDGWVIDIQDSFKESLPIVEGLLFDQFKMDEALKVDNQEAFDVVLEMSKVMGRYELLDIVVKLDVSDVNKIYICIGKIEILIGDISNIDEKIRTMAEIVKNIPEGDRGTIDLSDLTKPLVFKYLT